MRHSSAVRLEDPGRELGDATALARQIGSAGGLWALAHPADLKACGNITDAASVKDFLERYRARILEPVELPAIRQAYEHASRNETRELIHLDGQLKACAMPEAIVRASRRVGKAQLRKMRPLRDHRVVQRYLRAVEAGEAEGWHTIVYGLFLSVYSLPPRQGLLHYARQTCRGFVESISEELSLGDGEQRALLEAVDARLVRVIEEIVTPLPPGIARVSGG